MKKKDAAEAKPRYAYKVVRALQPMSDGIEIRQPDDEFVFRVTTHMPMRDEKYDKNGFLVSAEVVRDAKGNVQYYETDDSDVFEILRDATPSEYAELEAVWNDPVILLPDHQRPPEHKSRRPAPSMRTQPAATTSGGVL